VRIAELLRQLLEKLKSLLALKCECYSEQTYNQIIRDLENMINLLEDWYKRAVGGELGAVARENQGTCQQS
jgi:ribonuclease HIII